jgi:hypothetical protein
MGAGRGGLPSRHPLGRSRADKGWTSWYSVCTYLPYIPGKVKGHCRCALLAAGEDTHPRHTTLPWDNEARNQDKDQAMPSVLWGRVITGPGHEAGVRQYAMRRRWVQTTLLNVSLGAC